MQKVLIAIVLLLSTAADWPQWRGPNRDGTARGFTLPKAWPAQLKEEWKVAVGQGHSSPVVSGGKVYLHVRQGEEEVVLCLEPASGREIWRTSYPAPYEVEPVAASHGKGPKSTPAVSGGRVYSFGISGILSCLDAEKGALLWRKDFQKHYPRTSPLYGTALSPLIEGDLCIVHVGGHDQGALTAFDVQRGSVKWSWDGDGPGYASPVVLELAGERQVVAQTQNHLVGVSARTGTLKWRLPFKTAYDQNIVTPAAYRDRLIVSGLDQGTAALRIVEKKGKLTPEEVWRNPEVPMYMSSPVVEGNLLFGFSHKKKGQFFCLDAETGTTLWKGEGGGGENAAILSLGPALLVLTSDADLFFLEASAQGYRSLHEYKVAASPTWAHPAIDGERILIKDRASLVSLTLKAEP